MLNATQLGRSLDFSDVLANNSEASLVAIKGFLPPIGRRSKLLALPPVGSTTVALLPLSPARKALRTLPAPRETFGRLLVARLQVWMIFTGELAMLS